VLGGLKRTGSVRRKGESENKGGGVRLGFLSVEDRRQTEEKGTEERGEPSRVGSIEGFPASSSQKKKHVAKGGGFSTFALRHGKKTKAAIVSRMKKNLEAGERKKNIEIGTQSLQRTMKIIHPRV